MTIQHNVDLKPYHTFGVSTLCHGLVKIYNIQDIYEFLARDQKDFIILGGGSNVLFTKEVEGYVLVNQIKGIEVVDEDEDQVMVKVGAGENWHQFVQWAVAHRLWGLENLSLIPGSVGAAPMQNIGAYGVEQEACFHSLNAIDLGSGVSKVFFKSSCNFGYRESVFKSHEKGKYFITHVTYLLSKKPKPMLQYADLAQRVGEQTQDIKVIANTIIAIRQSKLPDPNEVGNAGSFFKNPVISVSHFQKLKLSYPDIVSYPAGDNIKLPAAWLIDQCGFKGKQVGNTGSYKNQALVIVNHGGATGDEIYQYACTVQKAVKEKFGVELEMEVNVIM